LAPPAAAAPNARVRRGGAYNSRGIHSPRDGKHRRMIQRQTPWARGAAAAGRGGRLSNHVNRTAPQRRRTERRQPDRPPHGGDTGQPPRRRTRIGAPHTGSRRVPRLSAGRSRPGRAASGPKCRGEDGRAADERGDSGPPHFSGPDWCAGPFNHTESRRYGAVLTVWCPPPAAWGGTTAVGHPDVAASRVQSGVDTSSRRGPARDIFARYRTVAGAVPWTGAGPLHGGGGRNGGGAGDRSGVRGGRRLPSPHPVGAAPARPLPPQGGRGPGRNVWPPERPPRAIEYALPSTPLSHSRLRARRAKER
jgi:hypothetical protein